MGQHRQTRLSRLQRHADRPRVFRNRAHVLRPTGSNHCDGAGMNPLDQARIALAQGFDQYEYDTCKWQSKVCLHLGDLAGAIWNTQVCLFIGRLRRVM